MLIEKSDLLKTLRTVAAFDINACPYIAIHFPVDGKPEFYRSSSNGFVQTKGFMKTNVAYASLGHFQDCLKVSPDVLEINLKPDGVRLNSTESVYDNVYHVHTVRESAAGVKEHLIGEPRRVTLDPTIFSTLDVRPFHLATPPVLKDGRLMLAMTSGNVIWKAPDALKGLQLNPRESFLRFACGQPLEDLMISERGYWGAVRDGLVTFISGHITGAQLFDRYNVPGNEVTRFSASRLVDALSRATVLSGSNDKVEIDPKHGVVCRDKYGNEQKMGLGASNSTWSKFTIMGFSAKLLVDALGQSAEEEAVLYSVPPKPGQSTTMRLVRGDFEVNFNVG